MMKINKWIMGLIALSVLGTIIVYPSLPEQIPVHWGVSGEVDRYGGKITALITAFLPIALSFLMVALPKIDPKRESYKKHGKAYGIFANLLMVFLVLLHWTSLLAALEYNVNVPLVVGVSVGILFIAIGNYMGQIRHNYFFGIRTPWTLANDEVWAKTHRMGSWVFIAVGILFIVGAVLNNLLGIWIAIGSLIAVVVFLYAYSYFLYKRITIK